MSDTATLDLYAQPYSWDAKGFYFNSLEDYQSKYSKNKDSFGNPVEEYEFQIIDGTSLECELWKALGGDGYVNLPAFFELLDIADDYQIKQIIAKNNVTGHEWHKTAQDYIDASEDVTIYEITGGWRSPFAQLAEQFVVDGLYGEIPDSLQYYIDYEAIGRDLRHDGYVETEIDGQTVIVQAS